MTDKIQAFLDGIDDVAVLEDLYDKRDDLYGKFAELGISEIVAFSDAWEIWGWILSDGFETLFDQDRPFSDWIDTFERVGCNKIIPILIEVSQIVPDSVYLQDHSAASGEFIRGKWAPLKACLERFFDHNDQILADLCVYVRSHRNIFFS